MDPMIIENFLPEAQQAEMEDTIFGYQMPWNFYANTNAADLETRPGDAPQFVHGFIQDSRDLSAFVSLPHKIVAALGLPADSILRAKANILPRDSEPIVHPRHIDEPNPHLVMIYYVNDADGDTCLYHGADITHRIAPARGRAVIFDGRTYHASSSPIEARFRSVINFNLKPDTPLSVFEPYRV